MIRPSDIGAELSEEEFRLLRDFIHERVGLFFDDTHRAMLRSRLASRLSILDLRSFEDYYRYLRFSPQREEEFERLVSHVTNNETYFYREQPQLTVFCEHALKALKERKGRAGTRTLRVLSAGCSTGEEPLTLAMLVHDSGHFFWGWDISIVGLDLDPAALERAQRGQYFTNSFRATTPAVRDRFFTPQGAGWQVRENIQRMVTFRQGNIVDEASYAGLAPLDVVFCRNVLIYFSDGSTRKAVSLFFDLLAPGGYLFLGHAESLSRITNVFDSIRFQGALIYQKPEVPR